jgi:hypothetical protein
VSDIENEIDAENIIFQNESLFDWKKYYLFFLDVLPDITSLDWRCGRGRWGGRKKNGEINLLLAKFTSAKSKSFGKYARFVFNRNGILLIVIENLKNPKIVLGDEKFIGQRIIPKLSIKITLRDIIYIFDFTIEPDNAVRKYQKKLTTFLETYLGASAPQPDVSATPSEIQYIIDDWIITGIVGRELSDVITVTKHRITAEIMTIKEATRRRIKNQPVIGEIIMLKRIPYYIKFTPHFHFKPVLIIILYSHVFYSFARWFMNEAPNRSANIIINLSLKEFSCSYLHLRERSMTPYLKAKCHGISISSFSYIRCREFSYFTITILYTEILNQRIWILKIIIPRENFL